MLDYVLSLLMELLFLPKRQYNLKYRKKKRTLPGRERKRVCFALGNISIIRSSISFTNQAWHLGCWRGNNGELYFTRVMRGMSSWLERGNVYSIALFPGVTISPVVPDVKLVTLSTLFTPAACLSFHVLVDIWVGGRELQTKLSASLVDPSGGFNQYWVWWSELVIASCWRGHT